MGWFSIFYVNQVYSNCGPKSTFQTPNAVVPMEFSESLGLVSLVWDLQGYTPDRSFPWKITIQQNESFPAIKISGVKLAVCNPLVVATGTSGEQQRGYKSIDLYRLQPYHFFHAAFSFHTVFKISQQYNTMLHTYILLGQFKKEFCLPTWNSVLIL